MEQKSLKVNSIWEQETKKYDLRSRLNKYDNFPDELKQEICSTYERFEIELQFLLEKYNLKDEYHYFKLLLYKYHFYMSIYKGINMLTGYENQLFWQLFEALNAFNFKNISVHINTPYVTESITNTILLDVIKNSLVAYSEYLIKYDNHSMFDLFRKHAYDFKGDLNKRGRRQRHALTGYIIDNLQSVLQKHTVIRAEDGVIISREQSRFVFEFLVILGVYQPNDIKYPEDSLRSILTRHKKEN